MTTHWMLGGTATGITTIGDPLLRQVAEPVPAWNPEVDCLLTELTQRLRELGGAGLAAPQIGVGRAVAVVEVRRTPLFPTRPESGLITLVNPCVIEHAGEDEQDEDWEGCFSVPNLIGRVRRPTWVTVEHLTGDGTSIQTRFEGYVARVVQHEIDHLNGILYVDKLTSTRTLCTEEHYSARLATQ